MPQPHHRFRRLRYISLGLLVTLTLGANAAIYKTVDENGKVIFTDNPKGKKAEKVELRQTNTQESIAPTPPPTPAKTPKEEPLPGYQVSINSPAEGTHIPPGQQVVTVAVNLTPALAEGHHLQATLNGQPFGPQSASSSLSLNNLYRGSHQLGVLVLDSEGEVLARSLTVTIYVHRPVVNRPN